MNADPRSESRPDVTGIGAAAFVVSPFSRLVRTQVFSIAGDSLLAIALADSLFFNVDPNDARWKVAAYLLLTLAPFAIVSPFLSPLMDRLSGGHRYTILGSVVIRAVTMFALVRYVQGPLLFPLAFLMLVMGKTHAVAKAALIPSMVTNHEQLVRSNSRLTVTGGIAGAAAGVPGIILLQFGGAPWVLVLGGCSFVVAAVLAMRIPAVKVAPLPPEPEEQAELRSAGIRLAASSMGYLRGIAGFITLMLAFDLRGGIDPGPTEAGVEIGHRVRESLGLARLELATGGAPAWHFGVAIAGLGMGGMVGALVVPRLRSAFREERILAQTLFALAGIFMLATLATGVIGAFLAGFAVSFTSTGGRQPFDAIVQRDAPEANLGRSFGRFESRFQLIWVVGALLPVVLPIPARAGYLMVVVTALFFGTTYWYGVRPDPRVLLRDDKVVAGAAHRARHAVDRIRPKSAPTAPTAQSSRSSRSSSSRPERSSGISEEPT